MKKYCVLICGTAVAILSYSQIKVQSPRNTELINTRIPRLVKTEKRFVELKRDSNVLIPYSVNNNQSTTSVR